jgi:hypothetical protein
MDPKSEREFDDQASKALDLVFWILVGMIVLGLLLWFCCWMANL